MGATIPEIENFTAYNPRQLMRPEPKLLVGPGRLGVEKAEADEMREQADEPEFRAYMEKMARGFLERGKQPDNTPETGEESDEPSSSNSDEDE